MAKAKKKDRVVPQLPELRDDTVLGLDQSLTHTAMRVMGELYEHAHGDSASVKTKPDDHPDEIARVTHISLNVGHWLDNWQPSLIAMEGYSFSKNGMAALGELGGELKRNIYHRRIPLLIVPPFTLKKFTTNEGNAAKEVMMMCILEKWGYKSRDNNDADAYALARFAQMFARGPSAWTKAFAALAEGVELRLKA
jgi:Holliday junction resolvasome RuvABC endonuclease subunit